MELSAENPSSVQQQMLREWLESSTPITVALLNGPKLKGRLLAYSNQRIEIDIHSVKHFIFLYRIAWMAAEPHL